jgi:hypothetical protein
MYLVSLENYSHYIVYIYDLINKINLSFGKKNLIYFNNTNAKLLILNDVIHK